MIIDLVDSNSDWSVRYHADTPPRIGETVSLICDTDVDGVLAGSFSVRILSVDRLLHAPLISVDGFVECLITCDIEHI